MRRFLSLSLICLLAGYASEAPAQEGCGEEEAGGEYTPEKGTATIRGVVRFEGEAPKRRPIDTGAEKYCSGAHAEKPLLSETVVVGPEGGLANVFVQVTRGLENWKFPAASGEKLLDQNGCQYVPHVLSIQVGQAIRVRNSDPIMHNIHAYDLTSGRDLFNFSQTQQGAEQVQSKPFARPGVVQVKCDVHGWMGSYVCVSKTPFHAVTGEDGAFTLEKLPPGEYTVEAWHEKYGKATETVTVADGQTVETGFKFAAK
jgi:plastocyanin